MTRNRVLLAGRALRVATVLMLCAAIVPPASGRPEDARARAVSPGSPTTTERLATSCPAFSWTAVDGASGYELIVYRFAQDGTLAPTLETHVPDGAGSWTPSAAACPAPGARHAWAVRAITERDPGRWSELLLFETPGAPSDDEVRQALDTLRRYSQEGREGAVEAALAPSRVPDKDRFDTGPSGKETRYFLRADDRAAGTGLTTSTLGADPGPRAVPFPSSFSLSLDGDVDLGGFLFQFGETLLHTYGYRNTALGRSALESTGQGFDGSRNAAFGYHALQNNSTGHHNAAFGSQALASNVSGSFNTATGYAALQTNLDGERNTAVGSQALVLNTYGDRNTASGYGALLYSDGDDNTASGAFALFSNTSGARNTAVGVYAMTDSETGNSNVAVGYRTLHVNVTGNLNTAVGNVAMFNNTEGTGNTAVGYQAGSSWIDGDNNIAIGRGVTGTDGDDGVIRIGGGSQSQTFIAGIDGVNVSGVPVIVTTNDQLGVAASSARFKQDVHDLQDFSRRLRRLRPVSFRYKDEFVDLDPGRQNPLEFGLVAEEVTKVFPELVVNDVYGRPFTVRYNLLAPLLLAELQRQDAELADLRRQVRKLSTKQDRR